MEWVLFAVGEAPTVAAAVSSLADDLRPTCWPTLTQTERECLARIMIKTAAGRVAVGPHAVEWRSVDGHRSDMEYRIA